MKLTDDQRATLDELERIGDRVSQYGLGAAWALRLDLEHGPRDRQDEADLKRVLRVIERRATR